MRAVPVVPFFLAACTSVVRPPEFVERVGGIERARLEQHLQALEAIGPRPVEDREASARTVAWLRAELEALGYEVTEEPVPVVTGSGVAVARVRRADAGPDGEERLLRLPPGLLAYGPRVIESRSRALRAEGWEVLGYRIEEAAAMDTIVVPNLLAERVGELPDRVIEISAHYDTVAACPGASDNSSGVAAVLEVARVLADARPRKTVRFCFFAAEERGLLGSREHVARLQEDPRVVEALVNLDSVGRASHEPGSQDAPVRIPLVTWMPSTGDFLTVIGTFSSGWLGNVFEASARAYVPELRLYSANRIGGWFADARRSDHAPYWEADLPAVFLTDTGEFRWDDYHRPEDRVERLDLEFLERVARAAAATVLELTLRD
jgi:aminopeptidase YwaD